MRALDLTKEKSKLLGSRLKEEHLFESGTSIYHFKTRDEQFTQFLRQDSLMNKFGIERKTED